MMKKCSKCGELKDLYSFAKDRTMKSGLYSCCKVCKNLAQRRSYAENPEKRNIYDKLRYAEDPEYYREVSKRYKAAHPFQASLYKRTNRGKINAQTAKRRAAKKHRMPVWSDPVSVSSFYKNCPKGYHVDHIIPLRGQSNWRGKGRESVVSGLHVLSNLQYLSASDNCRKSNNYEHKTVFTPSARGDNSADVGSSDDCRDEDS